MARPIKHGLDYFSHDVDAANDEKIETLRALYKNDGYAFYFILLERIYRTEKAELDLSAPHMVPTIASKVQVEINLFNRMLDTALNLGCFDKTEYENRKVLTSPGIKRRFEGVVGMRERWRAKKEQKNTSELSKGKTTEETGESKVKESKGKKRVFVPPQFDEVKQYFEENGYSLEQAKKFFEYYSVSGWKDSEEKPVRNWKQKAIAVWFKDENRAKSNKREPEPPAHRPFEFATRGDQ